MSEAWQSVTEYVLSVFKVWWAVVAFLLAVVGLVRIFVELESFPLWVGIVMFFVGLLVAPFGAFHRVRLERDRMKESSPAIHVEPKRGINDFYLEVKNVGASATFKAQIHAESTRTERIDPVDRALEDYLGWWEQAAGCIAEIATGQRDRLKIACIPSSPLTLRLRLYLYDAEYDRKNWRESPRWHPLVHDPSLRPEYKLQVTISSTSSPMEPFTMSYRLRSDLFAEFHPG